MRHGVVRALAGLCAVAAVVTCSSCDLLPIGKSPSAPPSVAGPPTPTGPPPGPTDAPTGPTDAPPAPTGVPTDAPPGAGDLDACSVLTRQEAEKVVGRDLQSAQAADLTCTYSAPPSGSPGQATVFVGTAATSFCETEIALGHPRETIPGIADTAFVIVDAGSVCLQKGPRAVALSIIVSDSEDPGVPARLRAAATTAASRM